MATEDVTSYEPGDTAYDRPRDARACPYCLRELVVPPPMSFVAPCPTCLRLVHQVDAIVGHTSGIGLPYDDDHNPPPIVAAADVGPVAREVADLLLAIPADADLFRPARADDDPMLWQLGPVTVVDVSMARLLRHQHLERRHLQRVAERVGHLPSGAWPTSDAAAVALAQRLPGSREDAFLRLADAWGEPFPAGQPSSAPDHPDHGRHLDPGRGRDRG